MKSLFMNLDGKRKSFDPQKFNIEKVSLFL